MTSLDNYCGWVGTIEAFLSKEVSDWGKSLVTFIEIFGSVLGMIQVESLDEAVQIINQEQYVNMGYIFTSSSTAACKFRYEADAGNIGVNIGVAAPRAYFPFSGRKDSYLGTLHSQDWHVV